MVEHMVIFRLKESATAEQREQMLKNLATLKEQIPGIVDLSTGVNFSDRSQGFNIGLVVRFTDRAALEAYGPHPAHQAVVTEFIRPITDNVIVVDYEF